MKKNLGQSTIELILTSTLLLVSISGGTMLFKLIWLRGKCAYVVFETTRSRLSNPTFQDFDSNENRPSRNLHLQWHESTNSVVGKGVCGKITERIGFQKLEHLSRWGL